MQCFFHIFSHESLSLTESIRGPSRPLTRDNNGRVHCNLKIQQADPPDFPDVPVSPASAMLLGDLMMLPSDMVLIQEKLHIRSYDYELYNLIIKKQELFNEKKDELA